MTPQDVVQRYQVDLAHDGWLVTDIIDIAVLGVSTRHLVETAVLLDDGSVYWSSAPSLISNGSPMDCWRIYTGVKPVKYSLVEIIHPTKTKTRTMLYDSSMAELRRRSLHIPPIVIEEDSFEIRRHPDQPKSLVVYWASLKVPVMGRMSPSCQQGRKELETMSERNLNSMLEEAARWVADRLPRLYTEDQLEEMIDLVDNEFDMGLSGSAAHYIASRVYALLNDGE